MLLAADTMISLGSLGVVLGVFFGVMKEKSLVEQRLSNIEGQLEIIRTLVEGLK